MQKPYDLLAKGLLEGALQGPCEVRVEEQAVADARAIDTVVVPDPQRRDELETRGVLGAIAAEFCVIEAYHDPPDVPDVDECQLKALALDARQRAAWKALPASERGPLPPRPRLWILSAGDPETLRRAWAMVPMPDWPTGCYWTGSSLGPHVVVIRMLPRTRDTLLLRLLGAGPPLKDAYDDLRALPADAWERGMLVPTLELLRLDLPRMGMGEYDSQEDTMRYQEAVKIYQRDRAEYEAEARADGLKEGLQEGLREGLREGLALPLRLCQRKLGRELTTTDQDALLARLSTVGADRFGDVVLDLDGPALDRWLHDPNAV